MQGVALQPLPDSHCMQLALQQAQAAAALGEVPVGAVVVAADGCTVLGRGHNRCIVDHDPSAHAEMAALRQAAQTLGNYRLDGCTLYVTLEPCAMCSGAALHARLARVVYAAPDPKTGAAGSVLDVFGQAAINHHTQAQHWQPADVAGQAVQQQCVDVLRGFFRQRRAAQLAGRAQAAQAPVREDALRPDACVFATVHALQPLQAHSQYALLHDEPARPAWRMHYWDTAPHQAGLPTAVLVHGYAGYGLLWADVMAVLQAAGWRVLAPDLLGCGHSDKPKKLQQHRVQWHVAMLVQCLQQAGLAESRCAVLVTQGSAGLLADGLMAAAPFAAAAPVEALQEPQTPVPAAAIGKPAQAWYLQCQRRPVFDLDAHWGAPASAPVWSAPYPDAGHRAILRWPQWAQGEAVSALHGHALLQWLRHNATALLARLQAVLPDSGK